MFALNLLYVQIVFYYYFADNVGVTTNSNKTFSYTYPRTICFHYLRILFTSFGVEDFQRFALNLLHLNCLCHYSVDNAGGTTIGTNFNFKCPRTIFVQHLRILWSSFGEEDFRRFALNLLSSIVFHYYFTDNVGGTTI